MPVFYVSRPIDPEGEWTVTYYIGGFYGEGGSWCYWIVPGTIYC